MLLWIAQFIIGVAVLAYSADMTVENALKIAEKLKLSPLLVGILLISVGTSLPEISNSITSSVLGHGDINVGDSIGSTMAQLTLVLGILVLLTGRTIHCSCDTKLISGAMVLGIVMGVLAIENGYINRIDALLLIISYYILITFVYTKAPKSYFKYPESEDHGSFFWLAVSLLLVAVSSWLTVDAIIDLSRELGVPEFLISFFGVAIGTSVPELAVGLTAVKKGHYELAIGDNFGSNLTDMTLSLASGPLFAPIHNITPVAAISGWYLVIIAGLLVLAFEHTKRIDKPIAVALILTYFGSYFLINHYFL